MKQGTSNPTTYPPQRTIVAREGNIPGVAQIGNCQPPRYGFMPPDNPLGREIPQPGGTGQSNEGNNGTQKG